MIRNTVGRAVAVVGALVLILAAVLGLTAGPVQAASQKCQVVKYPDGKTVYQACLTWSAGSGSTWYSWDAFAWNPAVPAGGHTDNLTPMFAYGRGGVFDWADQLEDTETQAFGDNVQYTQGANTVWWQTESTYDGACYRVFISRSSGSTQRIAGGCPSW